MRMLPPQVRYKEVSGDEVVKLLEAARRVG
jgi:hypothetical protein